MAEWLERAVAVREVSGSNPGRGGHKNLCWRREPSGYVSFRRAVKWQRFHALNTLNTKPRTTQHSLHVRTGFRSVPTRCRSLISFRIHHIQIHLTSFSDFISVMLRLLFIQHPWFYSVITINSYIGFFASSLHIFLKAAHPSHEAYALPLPCSYTSILCN